ncbi:NAD(P)-binding domain-containing protein [Rozella allomycis CSF55]|uniref:NAD(P)-binding domain-containing protein n=1 Tax=Rozella allomycis (strain CSF55) TaxID=988480 RepID=A0A075ASY8_ROZAC|nr:NAD(P)-binding domain-containing protein [Rozella allomycis CSF55]|eukprot:EPZ33383.1 NAD(P)-binding domain-containing protein [Rozella allomycis CSF55]
MTLGRTRTSKIREITCLFVIRNCNRNRDIKEFDNAVNRESEIGRNFFSRKASAQRGAEAIEILSQLNENVVTNFIAENPIELIGNDKFSVFDEFNLIIVADQMPEKSLEKLESYSRQRNIPLILCRSYGLVGYTQISLSKHCVLNSRQENKYFDLCLNKPFEELCNYCDSIDMESMSSLEYSHIPFVVILLKVLNEFKKIHGRHPETSQDKDSFKKMIKKKQKTGDEENFNEALHFAHKVWSKFDMKELNGLFEKSRNVPREDLTPFWILVKALKVFYDENSRLPLNGALPDMHSDTESYIMLQGIYKNKSNNDKNNFNDILKRQMQINNLSDNFISEEEIEDFFKNCHQIKVLNFPLLADESNRWKFTSDIDLNLYYSLKLADKFKETFGKYPSQQNVDSFQSFVKSTCDFEIHQDAIKEIIRYQGCQLHNIASFIGGVASQEIIKLLTNQYVPASGIIFFNGTNNSHISTLKI